jgi:DNA gyrase subunit A
MQLRRLEALERQKIEEEYREITEHIGYLRSLLADRKKILALIREDMALLREKYGDERRSQIVMGVDGDLDMEDLIADEDVFISITRVGYVKRTPVAAYRVQARGGKGLRGMGTRDQDELEHLFAAGTHNTLLFFTDQGKVYATKAYEIPELDRTARGTSLMNILPLMPDEKVTAALPVHDFGDAEYLTMITRKGRIKRVEVGVFESVRPSGLIAINLDEGDRLGWVKMTRGGQDLILISEQGKGIRFNEEEVRPMGRAAAGVNAMRLDAWDRLAGADVVTTNDDLLLITEHGFGKRTPLREYRRQGRYGMGIKAMTLSERTGRIMGARVVTRGDEISVITAGGIIIRTSTDRVSRQGRNSRGVRIMDLRGEDTVVSLAVVREGSLSQVKNGDEERPAEGEVISKNGEDKTAIITAG